MMRAMSNDHGDGSLWLFTLVIKLSDRDHLKNDGETKVVLVLLTLSF